MTTMSSISEKTLSIEQRHFCERVNRKRAMTTHRSIFFTDKYKMYKLIPGINVVATSAILDTNKSECCFYITDGDRLMSSWFASPSVF